MDLKKLITYISFFFIIVLIFIFGLYFVYNLSGRKNPPAYYKQGLEFYNKGDFQNAYYNFLKIYPTSELFLNGLYRSAKSADLIGDKKTAIKKYTLLETFLKNENVTPFVLWRIGNLHFELNEKGSAKSAFLKLKKNYGETEYGIASNYILSKIETNPDKRKEYLIEYIKYSPSGKFAKDVLITLFSDSSLKLNVTDKAAAAKCLYENGAYNRAISVLKEIPIEISWVYLIKALDKLNSSNNVVKVGDKGFSLDNSHFDEETLSDAVSIYLKHSSEGALSASKKIYETASDKRIKGIALYKNALYSARDEEIRKKARFYESFPDSKYASYVLYSLFIESLSQGKTILALKYGKMHLNRYNEKETTPSVLYFVASLKKKAMDASYKETLNRLLSEYPNTYYAYRAYSTLINPNFTNKRNLKVTKKTSIEFPCKDDNKIAVFFENFVNQRDFSAFDDFRIKDSVVKSWVEYKKGNRALSSVIARDYIIEAENLPKRNEAVWKLAYPVYYSEEINKYSKERNLNPYLILSLIKEESHFNPDIRSSVGATGLMQIMPSTAEMVAGEKHSTSELTDEELNIRLGTKYFQYLMETFSNNEPLCVLSYNSGPNAVKKWLSQNEHLSFDIMVENIPYKETKDYVKKVYTAYWNYLLTYEGIKI